MFKKLGLMALSTIVLGSPLLGIASADTVDGYTSSSDICVDSISNSNSYITSRLFYGDNGCNLSSDGVLYYCVSSSDAPFDINGDGRFLTVSSSDYCSSSPLTEYVDNYDFYFYGANADPDNPGDNISISGKFYFSNSPITYGSSAGGDSSDGSIGVPSGFTDSVNGLVSNFAGSIGNYAPTLIIVGLGVVLLFTFWGIIRSWAVRIFNRRGK